MDGLENAIDEAGEVAGAITEPVRETAAALGDSMQSAISELAAAVRINTETHAGNRDAIGRIEAQMSDLANKLAAAVDATAGAAVEVVEAAAEVAADIPEATAEAAGAVASEGGEVVEAVVDGPSSPPTRKTRGMIGSMKRNKRR